MTAFEIPYDSDQHRSILKDIRERHEFSRRYMERRYDRWRESEERFRTYRPESEEDKKKRQNRKTGEIEFVTLEIPYSYAMLLSAHTYWTSVFMGRTPMLQVAARHGEPEMGVQAMEALLDYQVSYGKHTAPLFVWLLDVGKYGLGIIGSYWDEEKRVISRMADVPATFYGVPVPGKTKRVKQTAVVPGFQGNKIYNIRPYDFLPDPRVAIVEFQKGEFCGRLCDVGWNTILKRKEAGRYFNTDVLKRFVKSKAGAAVSNEFLNREKGSEQIELPVRQDDGILRSGVSGTDNIGLLEMYIELIPAEWKLGTGTMPEKWAFTVANNSVIIGAEPLGLYHDKFPFDILEYEVDGYSMSARGMLEITADLNDIMTWLFNTHAYNIRKVLNDQLIVDPSRLVMKDFETKGPRMIRAKPTAYGTDLRQAVHQLQVVDVTQGHLKDTQIVAEMMQRVLGINEAIMGQVNPGGRKTATEIRSSTTMGINRLKTSAEYFSAVGFSSYTEKLIQNTQQFYDAEQQFKIAGDLISGPRFMQVTPESIAGFYDYVPVDGTLPIDRFAQASLWKEILLGMSQMPQLAQSYDMGRIFAWMAQLSGLKNIQQFRIQVRPDQQIANQVQAGNLVPPGAGNGSGAGIGASLNGAGGIEGAPRVSGVGPTG